jgi:hypothetical protein
MRLCQSVKLKIKPARNKGPVFCFTGKYWNLADKAGQLAQTLAGWGMLPLPDNKGLKGHKRPQTLVGSG